MALSGLPLHLRSHQATCAIVQVKKADQALQQESSLTQKLKQEMTAQQNSAQRQVGDIVLIPSRSRLKLLDLYTIEM